jgi:sarcosine oxidase subunit gamma
MPEDSGPEKSLCGSAGVIIGTAAPRSVAGIGSFRNHEALREALQAEFGIAIPDQPGFTHGNGITLSCLAPGRYLASGERDANLPARAANALGGIAAVTDQSDLWEIFTVSGHRASESLARLVPVDLVDRRFPIGALALTRAGHVLVRLSRVAEQCFELAVARSYAADLHWALQRIFPA